MAAGPDGNAHFNRIFDAQQPDHERGNDTAQDTGDQHSHDSDRGDAAVFCRRCQVY